MEILLKCVLLRCYAKQKNAEKGYALVKELLNHPAVKKDSTEILKLDLYKTFGVLFNELHQKDSVLKAIEVCGVIYRADTSFDDEYSYAKLWQYAEVYDSAIFYLQKTYQENSDSSNLRHVQFRQFATLSLANVYQAKNELEKANIYYQMVLNNPHFNLTRLQKKGLKDSLLTLNLKKGKDKTNLNLFYAAERIADTLAKEESKFIWADMSVRYETEEKEKKLKELAFAQKEFRFKVAIVFLLLMLILSLGAWRLYLNRQKRLLLLSEKQLLEVKQQLQQKELAELAAKQQLQEKEIEENKKHLQEFQANILAKNELIQVMEKQIQATFNALETPEKDKEIMQKTEFSHLKILTDKDWETYLTYIDKAYPNLKNRILSKYANLTQAELRLFLLIYTGFERKEIAEILGISADSVKKAKYRLRKKMALNEEQALEDFVKAF